jgi:hypothetical protein
MRVARTFVLTSLLVPVNLMFRVPATVQWKRLREARGDHGYIVYAERHEGSTSWIIPFSKLNLEVLAITSARRARQA